MSTVTVMLEHGLAVEGETHKEVELCELTAGEILDATEAAEKVVQTPGGPMLVGSPTRAGFLMLVKQIKRIGPVGAVTEGMVRKLHAEDLGILQDAAAQLDAAAQGVANRGRGDGGGGGTD